MGSHERDILEYISKLQNRPELALTKKAAATLRPSESLTKRKEPEECARKGEGQGGRKHSKEATAAIFDARETMTARKTARLRRKNIARGGTPSRTSNRE
jgi:hypothetical protein